MSSPRYITLTAEEGHTVYLMVDHIVCVFKREHLSGTPRMNPITEVVTSNGGLLKVKDPVATVLQKLS